MLLKLMTIFHILRQNLAEVVLTVCDKPCVVAQWQSLVGTSALQNTADSTAWRTLPVLRRRSQYKEHCQCFCNTARRSATLWRALQCRNRVLLYLSEKERLDSRHDAPLLSYWSCWVRRLTAGLQCSKMARVCIGFIVCVVAYTPKPCFWSHWPWWPHHTSWVFLESSPCSG